MRSISMVVTAYNEESNLTPTIESIRAALAPRSWDYELIIVDDGSSDRTGAIIDELGAADPQIRVYHSPRNLGLDRAYQTGIELATKELLCWVASNNLVSTQALDAVFDAIGPTDIVLAFQRVDSRRKRRRWLSSCFTFGLNLLFGLRVRYYMGPCVYPTADVRGLRTISRGSMILPEIVLRLLKGGLSYAEVPIDAKPRTAGQTKSFRLTNIIAVLSGVLHLFVDIQIRRNVMQIVAKPESSQA